MSFWTPWPTRHFLASATWPAACRDMSPTRHRMSPFGQQNRHANIRHVEPKLARGWFVCGCVRAANEVNPVRFNVSSFEQPPTLRCDIFTAWIRGEGGKGLPKSEKLRVFCKWEAKNQRCDIITVKTTNLHITNGQKLCVWYTGCQWKSGVIIYKVNNKCVIF